MSLEGGNYPALYFIYSKFHLFYASYVLNIIQVEHLFEEG